jgi:hypothetical protein
MLWACPLVLLLDSWLGSTLGKQLALASAPMLVGQDILLECASVPWLGSPLVLT